MARVAHSRPAMIRKNIRLGQQRDVAFFGLFKTQREGAKSFASRLRSVHDRAASLVPWLPTLRVRFLSPPKVAFLFRLPGGCSLVTRVDTEMLR